MSKTHPLHNQQWKTPKWQMHKYLNEKTNGLLYLQNNEQKQKWYEYLVLRQIIIKPSYALANLIMSRWPFSSLNPSLLFNYVFFCWETHNEWNKTRHCKFHASKVLFWNDLRRERSKPTIRIRPKTVEESYDQTRDTLIARLMLVNAETLVSLQVFSLYTNNHRKMC